VQALRDRWREEEQERGVLSVERGGWMEMEGGGGLCACLCSRLFSLSLHPSIFAILTVLCFLLWGGVGCAGVERERESVWKFHGMMGDTRARSVSSPPRGRPLPSPHQSDIPHRAGRALRTSPCAASPLSQRRDSPPVYPHTHPPCVLAAGAPPALLSDRERGETSLSLASLFAAAALPFPPSRAPPARPHPHTRPLA